VAACFGVSREQIRQIQARAMSKLRHPSAALGGSRAPGKLHDDRAMFSGPIHQRRDEAHGSLGRARRGGGGGEGGSRPGCGHEEAIALMIPLLLLVPVGVAVILTIRSVWRGRRRPCERQSSS
jgi:hypothetical protein